MVTDDYPTITAVTHNARVPGKVDCAYYAVDSSCVVPMNRLEKREYVAYTIRPKIARLLPEYLKPVEMPRLKRRFREDRPDYHVDVLMPSIAPLVSVCEIDHSVKPSTAFRGGSERAAKLLQHFLKHNLRRYARERNEPSAHATSDMSPYLHFGHISALQIALAAREYAKEHQLIADEFLEELIVRRELASQPRAACSGYA